MKSCILLLQFYKTKYGSISGKNTFFTTFFLDSHRILLIMIDTNVGERWRFEKSPNTCRKYTRITRSLESTTGQKTIVINMSSDVNKKGEHK